MLGAADGDFGLSTKLACDYGYECPAGTLHPFQYPCRGGYADGKGTETCTACEAGYWCPRGSVTSAYRYCPPGFDCSAGSIEDYRDSACPVGETKMRDNDSTTQGWDNTGCVDCEEGDFCNQHYPFNMDGNTIVFNTNYMEPKKCPPGTFY